MDGVGTEKLAKILARRSVQTPELKGKEQLLDEFYIPPDFRTPPKRKRPERLKKTLSKHKRKGFKSRSHIKLQRKKGQDVLADDKNKNITKGIKSSQELIKRKGEKRSQHEDMTSSRKGKSTKDNDKKNKGGKDNEKMNKKRNGKGDKGDKLSGIGKDKLKKDKTAEQKKTKGVRRESAKGGKKRGSEFGKIDGSISGRKSSRKNRKDNNKSKKGKADLFGINRSGSKKRGSKGDKKSTNEGSERGKNKNKKSKSEGKQNRGGDETEKLKNELKVILEPKALTAQQLMMLNFNKKLLKRSIMNKNLFRSFRPSSTLSRGLGGGELRKKKGVSNSYRNFLKMLLKYFPDFDIDCFVMPSPNFTDGQLYYRFKEIHSFYGPTYSII